MNRAEWISIGQRMAAKWPHQPPEDATLAEGFATLKDLPAEQVWAAVEVIYREGKEWPPTGGQIRAKIAELTLDTPSFGEAWRILRQALSRFGRDRGQEGLAHLERAHPLIAELARQIGWQNLCLTRIDGKGGLHEQATWLWKDLVARAEATAQRRGIAAADLPALERANGADYERLVATTMAQMKQLRART